MSTTNDPFNQPIHKKLVAMKLGDAIASVATPIARTLGMPCIDPETQQLRPESGCAKRKQMLNQGRYADAFFDVFWPTKSESKQGNKMQFIITKQISVEAETPEEAVAKSAEGKTIALNVTARPAPPQQQAQGLDVLGRVVQPGADRRLLPETPVRMGPGGVPMPATQKVG